MKRVTLFLMLILTATLYGQIPMGGWQVHFAFNKVETVEIAGRYVFGMSEGSIYSVDKEEGILTPYSKLSGLNGTTISQIRYDKDTRKLLIAYNNGNLDLLDSEGNVENIADLYSTQTNLDKSANDILIINSKAYIAMPWGLILFDFHRKEITDTYFIGHDASQVNLRSLCLIGDSIYAASADSIYVACLNDNLIDYSYWHTIKSLPTNTTIQQIGSFNGCLWLLQDSKLYRRQQDGWQGIADDKEFLKISAQTQGLYAIAADATYKIDKNYDIEQFAAKLSNIRDVKEDPDSVTCYLASRWFGIRRYYTKDDTYSTYILNGPNDNIPYRMKFIGNRLFVLQGGRYTSSYWREGDVMIYEDGWWTNITHDDLYKKFGIYCYDLLSAAAKEDDVKHFFIATYTVGLLEFQDDKPYKRYYEENSTIQCAADVHPEWYTRTDGLLYDSYGNLWVVAMDGSPKTVNSINIMSPQGKWYGYSLYSKGQRVTIPTSGEMFIDKRDEQLKWLPIYRSNPGIILFNDNGTPYTNSDDKVMFRNAFHDQNGNEIRPQNIHCMVQDKNNDIWVGTDDGLFIIENTTDFFTSDLVLKVIINRTDGSNLGDYLLDEQAVTAIAIDGRNRKWIGTQGGGIFLVSEDGKDEIQHFTTDNSVLLSDDILSIAINEQSGEVFIGTGNGLISYQSDAAEPHEDFSEVYAYPNPVRPDFNGLITISGLMEETVVKITNAAGELVCETRSNGGVAVWDGKDGSGKRVRTGVYLAQCATSDGKEKVLTKILVMH